MPLESLLELVKTLSDRIDRHGPALRQSESLTRYALIDPLLRELGWDTSDPNMVIPEYRVPNNQLADYALINDGRPVIVVESKKLDEPLQSGKALDQGILYCAHTGSKHFVLTDGRRWQIYESSNTTPVISFDLRDDPTQVCLEALALWHSSVESGNLTAAQSPVVEPRQPHQSIPEIVANPIPTPIIQSKSVTPVLKDSGWQPLSEFNPEKGSDPPTEILFPNNETIQIKLWKSVIVEITRWLVNNNLMGAVQYPIQLPSAYSRNIAHTEPTHKSGKEFVRPEQVGSLYVETHLNVQETIDRTCYIIEHIGQDPAHFKVRLP